MLGTSGRARPVVASRPVEPAPRAALAAAGFVAEALESRGAICMSEVSSCPPVIHRTRSSYPGSTGAHPRPSERAGTTIPLQEAVTSVCNPKRGGLWVGGRLGINNYPHFSVGKQWEASSSQLPFVYLPPWVAHRAGPASQNCDSWLPAFVSPGSEPIVKRQDKIGSRSAKVALGLLSIH